jgi:hypothetical protein
MASIFYPLFIANGITGIRDAGSGVPLDSLRLWQREILAGTRIGPPRQILDGPAIDDNTFRPCHPEPVDLHTCIDGPDAGRSIVDSLKAAGADMIKTYALSRATYLAVVAEARRVDIPVGGHAGMGKTIVTAIEASDSGVRILDHLNASADLPDYCINKTASVARCQEVTVHFQRNNTWWVPTLFPIGYVGRHIVPYIFQRLGGLELEDVPAKTASRVRASLPARRAPDASDALFDRVNVFAQAFWSGTPFHVTQMHDVIAPLFTDSTGIAKHRLLTFVRQAGLPVLAGTDVMGWPVVSAPAARGMSLPGFSLHTELALEVFAGLTPLEVLQAATLNPAIMLGATDSLGTVAAGKLADLVLLDADPLMNISNITLIRAVVENGRYFDRDALDRLVATAQTDATREHFPLIDSTRIDSKDTASHTTH